MVLTTDHVHFIGLGGIGMSALARVLRVYGVSVSGSDVVDNDQTRALSDLGVTVCLGHRAENLPSDISDQNISGQNTSGQNTSGQNIIVVFNTAIAPDNPELLAAKARGLSLMHRSALLQMLLETAPFAAATQIGITGTHGKTTVTGMLGHILRFHAAQHPDCASTIIAGGLLPLLPQESPDKTLRTNAVAAKNPVFSVAELDESDGSVLAYRPSLVALTNLELDHAEHFPGGLDDLYTLLLKFIGQLERPTPLFLNAECPQSVILGQQIAAAYPQHELTWLSVAEQAKNLIAQSAQHGGFQGCFQAELADIGLIALRVPGRFNMANALFAAAIALRVGVAPETIRAALAHFSGMGRRFERVAQAFGAVFYDDYAHHPTEVAATLQAARSCGKRVVAVFQPHRYTRLQALWNDFLTCFEAADVVVLCDVYAASEAPIAGYDTAAFAAALQARYPQQLIHHVAQVPSATVSWAQLRQQLCVGPLAVVQPGDCVLSLGAGSVTQLFRGVFSDNLNHV